MTKRLIAFFIVLAMVASFVPVVSLGVSAEGAALEIPGPDALKNHTDHTGWTKWTDATKMPTAAGNYYLDVDVNLSGAAWTAGADIKLCLNGHHVKQTTANQRVIDVSKTLTVFDCTARYEGDSYISGTITGGSRTYGAGVSVKNNAVLNLYSGAISGNANTAAEGYGGGIYLSNNKSNTLSGGVFNMYGGEVSGNSAVYGGGVYIPGHNTNNTYTSQPAKVNIYGGKLRNNLATTDGGAICQRFKPNAPIFIENAEISGNKVQSTATGKGCGGAIYVQVGGSLTIKDSVIKENISSSGAIYGQGGAPIVLENVQVIDNKANASGPAGIYVAGASTTLTVKGLVVLDGNKNGDLFFNNASAKPLYVNELASGSKLQYTTASKANTDDKVSTVIAIASGGKQSSWEDISIVCNGEELNYTSSGFKFGHYHGDQKYTAWESGSTLPSNGYNFLTQDVVRTKEAGLNGDSHICLNGHDITISPSATDTLRMIAVSGKVSIEDCTAHYEGDTYVSGKLTGGNRTYGAAVAVRAGGTFTLESGAIAGNGNNDEGGAVYINGGENGKAGGKFIMNGGEITGNTTKRGAIAIAAAKDTSVPFGTFIMNGGKIYGNTGDGIYTWLNTDVQLLGGTVEDTITTRCDLTIGETELKDVYLMGDTIFKVAKAKGAKVSFSTEKGGRYVSDALTDTTSTFTYQKDDFKLTTQEGKLYLAPAHEHCVEGETGCGHSQLGWNAWTDSTKLPESGNYFLETDVELTATAEMKGLNLCLNGHTVKNVADNTRVMNAASGTVTLTDCAVNPGSITGGNRDYGAGITVASGATLNLYNIIITGNENKTDGGAIYVRGGGTANMYSGKITGNTARNGAAVAIADAASGKAGVFNLYGGEISGNTTTGNGTMYGYIGAQFNLLGGKVTGNTANHGGAFYFGATMDKLTLGGDVQLIGNTTPAGKNDDVYLTTDKIITVGALNGAKIGVMNDGSAVQITDKEAQGFVSNRSSRTIVAKDGALWLADAGDHNHCLCDGGLSGCDHSAVQWVSWDATDSLPTTEGYYYLTGDVTLAENHTFNQNVHICLNGFTIRGKEGVEQLRLMALAEGKALTISDCEGTGLITGGNRDYGSAISVREKAVFSLYGGKIAGNRNGPDGAVYIARGTFNMYGGEISGNYSNAGGGVCLAETKNGLVSTANLYGGYIGGNEAIRGGGVYVYNGGILNLAGTKIEENTATKFGGGIYLKSGCSFTMTSGSVDGNEAKEFGGGVYAGRGEYIFSGGSVSGNKGGKDGGGMYCVAGFVTLSGTTFANNVSGGAGGGICLVQNVLNGTELLKGSFTMTGGILTGNESKNSGGGAYIRVADAKITGGKVTGNKANGNGGGFYFAGTEATLQNVEITKNTAAKDSGAVGAGQNQFTLNGEKVSVQAKITIGDGAKLNNNKANHGGAMSVYHATQLILEGGEIKNNNSQNYGGGIIVGKPGIFKMTGGTVSGNRAEKSSGGGLYFVGSASVQIKGGNITNNWCKKYGAGVYVNKCTVDIYGGYIGGNYTDESGAGVSSSASGIVNLYGGTVAGNTAKASAAGILIQSKSVLNLHGGTVRENKASSNGGGIFISNNSYLKMTGGKVCGNETQRYGSGLYAYSCFVTITGGEFYDNYSKAGGTVYITRTKEYTEVSGMHIHDNKADNSGGGLIFSRASGAVKNCLIENNQAVAGAGLLIQMEEKVNVDSQVHCQNLTIRNNKATVDSGGGVYIFRQTRVTMENCEITGNTAVNNGGGIYMNFGQTLNDYQAFLTMKNSKVEGNTAGAQGGGLFINNMMHLNLENVKVLDNTAAQEGAGIYGAKGSHLTVADSLISGNEAGKTGAAIYGGYDLNLLGGTITGNKSAEGGAVYLTPGMYDGHSYTNGKVRLAGNLIIKDNDCQADLYIDEGRVCGTTAEGFGEDTEIHVTLHSGLITTTLIAAFDYEGGDGKYIVTYGDKSITQIEPGAEGLLAKPLGEKTAPVKTQNTDILLYAGIGVIALAAVAGVVLVLLKKKKPVAK